MRYNRKGQPVFYLWQMFTFVRLTLNQTRELQAIFDREKAKYRVCRAEAKIKVTLERRKKKAKKGRFSG